MAANTRRGTPPRLGTSTASCYPCGSGYLAPRTRTPRLPKTTSATGPKRRIQRRTSHHASADDGPAARENAAPAPAGREPPPAPAAGDPPTSDAPAPPLPHPPPP